MFLFGVRFKDLENRYGIKRADFDLEENEFSKSIGFYLDEELAGFSADSREMVISSNIHISKDNIAGFFNANNKSGILIKDNDIKLIMI